VTRKALRAGAEPAALMELACACASARQAARAITQLYDRWLDGTGLEAAQFALLMAVNGHGDASQAAIGRRYGLDKTTISRNLKWLERRGLIVVTSADDGRERRFVLTAEGRKRLAGARPRWKKAQDHLRSGMTNQQWDTMFDAFRAVSRAARTAHRSLDIKDPTRRSSTIP
jgi:DNA-binding MarR family transcriptional regulator